MRNLHEQIIEEFYSGFADANSTTMNSCYHKEATFEDPVFGLLEGDDVRDMWEMLIEKSQGQLKICFSNVAAPGTKGFAEWKASYIFSSTNRPVVNVVQATFEFKDGLIVSHKDAFDLYEWSKQALGLKGKLFGWTSFFQKKIQQKAVQSLRHFQSQKYKNL
ncbi:nuclear transport factor 2 family protein [Flavobacterium tegetincola]|uniref:nuclear transport factor 2 family protein n=1 Tax=Flavobacterium tegetincola TaxID=150172 RepID=UPI00047DC3BF|nr:nuclear transport factor 2 family protein [Flavobacterium tegetincola]